MKKLFSPFDDGGPDDHAGRCISSWPGPDDGFRRHDGRTGHGNDGGLRNGGSGMMGMMDGHDGDMADFEDFSLLNLTPDQKNKINKIQLDLRKQHWALMGKNIDNKALLNDLYAADRPDPKKIGQAYASIFDIKRQMIESRIEAMNRMKDVLTKEQLDKTQTDATGWSRGITA